MWGLTLPGFIRMGGFSATFFAPYAVESVFGLSARDSSAIISSGYLFAILLNLVAGWICNRYSRWNVMILIILLTALLVPASFVALSRGLLIFGIGMVPSIWAAASSVTLDRKCQPVAV